MRRHRRRRNKKRITFMVIGLCTLIMVMSAGYAAFQTNLSINAKGNIVEKSRVIQSWTGTSNEDFHTDYYRENIVSATFLDNNSVPDNATESWNVSEDKKHGGVMAWVIPTNEDSIKYDLYIGANKGVIANEDSSYLFGKFTALKNIDFNNNFDTSNVTNMSHMFWYTISLIKIDLSSFNTSNVTNMASLFTMWTTNVEFAKGSKLTTIIFGDNFDTNNVTDMSDMFSGTAVTSLDLSDWNISNVIYMFHMFNGCNNLEKLNLCNWNTSNAVDMRGMFAGTTKLNNIYVGPNWITTLANTTDMFTNSGISSVTTGQC